MVPSSMPSPAFSNNRRNHCVQLSLLIILLMMIALISDFASYLFSSKDRANIHVKIIS